MHSMFINIIYNKIRLQHVLIPTGSSSGSIYMYSTSSNCRRSARYVQPPTYTQATSEAISRALLYLLHQSYS